MKKTIGTFIAVLLGCSSLWAQPSVMQYDGIKCKGSVPTDIAVVLSQDKSESNEYLRSVVMGGCLIYGTVLNDYVNTIADNLLKDDPSLRSQLHFYVYRSAEVNACVLPSGTVLVNLGLLAQVSNESELAFVLAHEIAHYALKHKVYAENYYKRFDKSDGLDKWLELQNVLRANESEADRTAIERYIKNSSYSYQSCMSVFDVLQYADLPFSEVEFTRSYVETPCYHFPEKYFLTTVSPVTNRDDRIDTLNTHPNIAKRRAAARLQIARLSDEGRSAFVQPESLFDEVRTLARFACVESYMTQCRYDKAIYNAYVLQKQYPNHPFLDEAIAAAFYGLSVFKNSSVIPEDVVTPYKKVEGEMQQLCYFLTRLSRPELSTLALRFLWEARGKYPQNQMLDDMCEREMAFVFVKNKMKHTDFSDYPMGTDPSTLSDSTVVPSSDNKYDLIHRQNVKVKPSPNFKTVNYMLCDYHSNPQFVEMANAVIAASEDQQVLDMLAIGKPSDEVKMLVDAVQVKIVPKNASIRSSLNSQKNAERISKNISKTMLASVSHLKMDPVHYKVAEVARFNEEQYNQYCKIQQWETEYFQKGVSIDNVVLYQSKNMDDVFESLGTSKFAYAYVVRKPYYFVDFLKVRAFFVTPLICPFYTPVAILRFALPNYNTEVLCGVVDMQTGRIESSGRISASSSMSKAYVNSTIYNALYTFKKGGKK